MSIGGNSMWNSTKTLLTAGAVTAIEGEGTPWEKIQQSVTAGFMGIPKGNEEVPAAGAAPSASPTSSSGPTREQRIAEEYARRRAAIQAASETLGKKSLLGNA